MAVIFWPFCSCPRACVYNWPAITFRGIEKPWQNTTEMGKITFFELKNFQGKTYECNSDFLDLQTNLNSCNSIRVEHGLWMVYERPNYMGNQYFLIVGEYPDYHHWTGVNDSIKSCRLLSQPAGLDLYKMRVYEKDDCQGELMDFVDDCPDVQSHFHYPNISSCHVLDGLWLFYEDPNYSGKQYLLRPGQYERFTDWGAIHGKIGSLKRVVEPL